MLLLILISLIALVQAPSAPSGTLAVRVVERGTNAPLSGVSVDVSLWASNATTRTALTAADGTATFAGLAVGEYEVSTASETHLAMDDPWLSPTPPLPLPLGDREIIRQFPGSATVRVRAERRLEVTFQLPLGGRITGRIVSPDAALIDATVTLYRILADPTTGYPVRMSPMSVKTRSDGSFAVRGLSWGTYLLSSRPGQRDRNEYSEVYHPGVVDLREATVLRISSGNQIDLPPLMTKAVRLVTISGRVDDETEGQRELIARDLDISYGDVTQLLEIPIRRDGAFGTLSDAGVSGLLYTRKAVDGSLLSAATAVLHVGADPLAGVLLKAIVPSTMSGRFVFARPYQPARYDRPPRIDLFPQGPDAWLRYGLGGAGGQKNETFLRNGIIGAHRIDAEAPKGWVVRGVVLEDGRNILDSVFEFEPGKRYDNVRVLLSPDAATINGRVEMPETEWVPPTVYVVPVDETLSGVRRYRHEAYVQRDGSFRVEGITPGREYYVTTCGLPCAGGVDNVQLRAEKGVRILIDRPGEFQLKELKR